MLSWIDKMKSLVGLTPAWPGSTFKCPNDGARIPVIARYDPPGGTRLALEWCHWCREGFVKCLTTEGQDEVPVSVIWVDNDRRYVILKRYARATVSFSDEWLSGLTAPPPIRR